MGYLVYRCVCVHYFEFSTVIFFCSYLYRQPIIELQGLGLMSSIVELGVSVCFRSGVWV